MLKMKISVPDLKTVQDSIEGKLRLNERQTKNVILNEKTVEQRFRPLLPLLEINPKLYREITSDRRVLDIGAYYFLPKIQETLEKEDASLEWIRIKGTRREITIIGNRSESEYYFVKPVLHSKEREIACKAAELRIGPQQYDTLDGFLTEEYLVGKAIGRIESLSEGNIYVLGAKIGNAFYKLHCEGIAYNNINAMAPANPESIAVFPDFGSSVKLAKDGNYGDDEIVSLQMHDFPFPIAEACSQDSEGRFLVPWEVRDQIRNELRNMPKEKFFLHDIILFYEQKIAPLFKKENERDAFDEGFRAAYLFPGVRDARQLKELIG